MQAHNKTVYLQNLHQNILPRVSGHYGILMTISEKTRFPFTFKLNGIYDHSETFPFDFEHKWKSIWFRKSKGKLSQRSYPIQFERKCTFLSVTEQRIDSTNGILVWKYK